MRTIICDLTRRQLEETGLALDGAVCREELEAAGDCLGCFGCWVRTPGSCCMRDALGELPALLARTDELWVISENAFGGYSPLVKRAVDRSIGYVHPSFRVVGGELHHRMRSAHSFVTHVRLYGPSTSAERACLERIAAANAVNLGSEVASVGFPASWHDVAGDRDGDVAEPRGAGVPGAARTGTPAPPRRAALVNASPRAERAATAHLLADLAEALPVYARMASVPTPELVDLSCPRAGTPAADELAGFDAVVLGYPLYVDALPSGLVDLLVRWRGTVAPGTRVYALANMGLYEPQQILPSFRVLENFCAAAGARWMGGVAVGGGGMVRSVAGSPRMGTLRRPVSEAIDRLIAALLSGASAGEDLVKPPIPRFAYRLAAERLWRSLAREYGADLDALPG